MGTAISEAPPPISVAPAAARVAARAETRFTSAYIVNPTYDWLLFLLPPLFALGLGIAIADMPINGEIFMFWDQEFTATELFLGILIHAHIVIVLFRSHANTDIFTQHPWRFVAIPIALYALMNVSTWALVTASVVATFWDVYHSGMQTFGFARIYDGKAGNDALAGRKLDWALNQLLYAGPILAGATMMDHVEDFEEYEDVGSVFFTSIPGYMEAHQAYLTWPILIGGTAFLLYYVFAQWRLHQDGNRVSAQKVFLLVSTGFVSIYTWGFNTWGEAFFIMNVFHAIQYFGIVWAMEKKSIIKVFGLTGRRLAKPTAIFLLLGTGAAYGYFVQAADADIDHVWAITLVVSLMHFWYDGFIWSVRKSQV